MRRAPLLLIVPLATLSMVACGDDDDDEPDDTTRDDRGHHRRDDAEITIPDISISIPDISTPDISDLRSPTSRHHDP